MDKDQIREIADRIAHKIETDLRDRSGFNFDALDIRTISEIRRAWRGIAIAELRALAETLAREKVS